MKTMRAVISLIIGIIFLHGSILSAYAEMPPDVKPGQVTNTVVWQTTLKPVTGKNETLQIVCLKGTVNEDTYDKGKITSTVGKFELRLTDSTGKILSANSSLFDFDMEFYFTNFNIIFDDYNNDGYVDFALGQTITSKPGGWAYKIYTIKDSKIQELSVKNQPYVFISGGGYYHKQLDKNGADGFQTVEYEGYQPKECIMKTYQWDGKQFYVSDVKTQKLVSEQNKDAVITAMSFWPEYGISLYSTNEPLIGGYKGYKGYYLYVRGEEKYYPDWESEYPIELQSLIKEIDRNIFAVSIINGSGTSVSEPTIITFNSETMSVIAPGPEYSYFYSPGERNTGQMIFSGGASAAERSTDVLLMINGELVSDINIISVDCVALVPLYQINDKLGIALNQTKNDVRWQMIDGVAYVSLESVAEVIAADFGLLLTDSERMIYPYDLIWIDTQAKLKKSTYNQNTVVQYTKGKLNEAFEKFKSTAKETYAENGATSIDNSLKGIKTKIDNLKYVGKFSHYLVLEGPYRILVDEYTGEIYFCQWLYSRTWLMKVDFNKPVSFALYYFAS